MSQQQRAAQNPRTRKPAHIKKAEAELGWWGIYIMGEGRGIPIIYGNRRVDPTRIGVTSQAMQTLREEDVRSWYELGGTVLWTLGRPMADRVLRLTEETLIIEGIERLRGSYWNVDDTRAHMLVREAAKLLGIALIDEEARQNRLALDHKRLTDLEHGITTAVKNMGQEMHKGRRIMRAA